MMLTSLALSLLLAGNEPASPTSAVQRIRADVEALASDAMKGRRAGTPEANAAAQYVADSFRRIGLQPGGADGSYFQTFDFVDGIELGPKNTLKSGTGKPVGRSWTVGADFRPLAFSSSGDVSGGVVFAGYGIVAKDLGYDDYAGLDVKGKVVLVASGTPAGIDSSNIDEKEQGEDAAKAHGAAAMIALPPQRYIQFFASPAAKEYILKHENVRLKKTRASGIPSAILKPESADRLLAKIGLTSAQVFETASKGGVLAPRAIDATARVTIAVTGTTNTAYNVVAVLDGVDPKLRNEYVALSAHFDHLKTNAKG
jgi:hypothetical protein